VVSQTCPVVRGGRTRLAIIQSAGGAYLPLVSKSRRRQYSWLMRKENKVRKTYQVTLDTSLDFEEKEMGKFLELTILSALSPRFLSKHTEVQVVPMKKQKEV